MKTDTGFRAWYYFRMGWSTYFVFFLGAINTLTVTYFLAIDNYPTLKNIFSSFELYIIAMILFLTPALVLVGFVHYKRTKAFRSEVDVLIESNPYFRRNTVNGELNNRLILKLLLLILKLSKKEEVDEKEIDQIKKMQEDITKFTQDRSFINNMDMDFLKKEIRK